MNLSKTGVVAASALAMAVAFATPAAADFWWETDEGKLYFDGASGNWGVFRFLDNNSNIKQDVAIYINGMGPQYTGTGLKPGTYDAQWFDYTDNDCGREAVDPDGKVARSWGVMSFTVKQDYNYFTADVWQCENNKPMGKFNGTPGK